MRPDSDSSKPVLSIILVNWNTREILRNCLTSIYTHTSGLSFEVFVVDNGSSDGSVQMVKNCFPQVLLLANSDNKGFAAANNQALALAKGEYVLLLNSDTYLLDNSLLKVIEFARQHPEAGLFGCRVLNADGTLQPTCFQYPSLLNLFLQTFYLSKLFPKSRFFGRERMTWWDRNDVREVEVITGCFLLVRAEVIRQIGLLDESFFMYGEETDWCYRARRAGWKLLFTPEARIVHLGGASSRQNRPEMVLQLRGSILYFIKKHHCRAAYWLSCLLVSLFFTLRVPYWLLRGLVVESQRKSSLATAATYGKGAVRSLLGSDGLRKKAKSEGEER